MADPVHRAETDLRTRLTDVFGADPPVVQWLNTRFDGHGLADVFLAPGAYPVVRMPWWATGDGLSPDDRAALAYSSIAGYLFVRIIDDVADGDHLVPAAVLPALGFFHSEFTGVFRRWFRPDHPFWRSFEGWWFATAAATADDLTAGPVDREAFERSAGRKTNAAVIPIAAALHREGRPDAIAAWERCVVAFGRWHQFQNDLEGLAGDQAAGATTWIISTARSQAPPGMSPRAWAWTVGLDWVIDQFDSYADEVLDAAGALGSEDLDAYLEARFSTWHHTFDTVRSQLEVIISASTASEE